MSDFTFKVVGAGVMLIIAAALVFVAKRQTVREPLTRFAIVRAGLIGTAAVYACWIAARIAQQFVIVLLVPVLFAVVLLLCARLFARVGARILARTCAVLGVLSLAVAAFLVWELRSTSEPTSS